MKLAFLATLLWLVTALPASSQAPLATKRLTNVIDSYPQLSKDGKLLLFQSNRSGKMQIYLSNADGTDIRQLTHLDFVAQVPCWSPDMKHIVFAGEPGGHSEIFVMNADGSGVAQLTHTGGDDSHPHWSADGSRIMFNSSRTTPDSAADWSKQWHELFSMKPDGSDVRQHTHFHTVCTFGSFSPDTRQIVYRKVVDGPAFQWDLSTIGRNSEVFVANADGSNEVNVSKNAAFDGWPVWSPDGKQIAFSSNRAGPANTGQIFVVKPDSSGLRQLTSGPGGFAQPSWSSDGRRIVAYQNWETAEYEYGNVAVIEFN
jgi:Tol biopolymer transport system component